MIKNILIATDFTDVSEHALKYGVALAKQLNAKVTVLHVYELPVYGPPEGGLVATADIAAKIHDAATTALAAAMDRVRDAGVSVESHLCSGDPVDEVERIARERRADLLVVGTHGRRGLARALIGSVAENLIRTSKLPVVAVHAPEAA